jgi:predicted nucleotidyltransferase
MMTTREAIIAKIQSEKEAISRCGIQSVGLFGSYARGEQTENSDIDLLIDFAPNKENFDSFMSFCDLAENLFSGYKVDVVTKNGLSPYIGPKILSEAIYV